MSNCGSMRLCAAGVLLIGMLGVAGCASLAETQQEPEASQEVDVLHDPDHEALERWYAAALEQTQATAMDEAEFWQLIDVLERSFDEPALERLVAALRALSESEVVAFEARLTLQLHALDTPRHWEAHSAADPFGGSMDIFLYERAAVIALGQEATRQALEQGHLPLRGEEGWGEGLLFVAVAALHPERDFEWWFEQVPLSYETGSNLGAWMAR